MGPNNHGMTGWGGVDGCNVGRGVLRGEEGGQKGVDGTQNFVYQKWPNKIVPTVKFIFPTMVTLVWRGGGFSGGGGAPPCGKKIKHRLDGSSGMTPEWIAV